MQSLTPTDVENTLKANGLSVAIHHFESSTATAQQAADALNCELGQIVKSLCFIIDKQTPIIVLTSGDQFVDDRKIASLFEIGRKKVKMANADECIAIYGYAPGGVPPIAHRTPGLPVYIDQNLRRYETVYAAAGTSNTIFPIPLVQLVELTDGHFADVVRSA